MAIADEVKAFIVDEVLAGRAAPPFDETTYLVEEEIIDSLGIFSLVEFIEDRWNVVVEPEEITLANFATLRAIVSLVEAKQAAA